MDRAHELQSGVSQRAASALLLRARRAASTCASFRALLIVLLVLVIRPTDSALAEPIEFPIVYTTTTSPPRVKRTTLIYDPAPSGGGPATAAVGSISTVATLPMGYGGGTPGAADGVALLGDGTVFALSRNSNLHRVDRLTGAVTFSILSLAASSPPPPISGSLRMDPSNTALWAPGVDGRIARVPIKPTLSPGTSHALQGVDTVIHGLGFAGGRAFYSSPAGVGGGSLGVLDTSSFTTTRLLTGLAAAAPSNPAVPQQRTSALVVDPLTGHLLVIGQQQITQVAVNWSVSPITMSIVSDRNLSGQLGSARLLGGTVDGEGRLVALTSDGRILLIDYSASELIASPGATVRLVNLESNLANLAPLSGPGSLRTSGKIWTTGGLTGNEFDGAFDLRNGQLSMVGASTGDALTADDFYLEPHAIYRIDAVHATMFSNVPLSPAPKAKVIIYADCDGTPGEILRTADATVTDTGQTFSGLRILAVKATTPDLWLEGGSGGRSYWVSVAGVANSPSAPSPWYWGTSGNQKIMGRPGKFKAPSLGFADWISVSHLPCGCSDFAFRIEGIRCGTLLDNGGPIPISAVPGPPGSPSLRSNTDSSTQSADDVPVPLHTDYLVCYARARIYTNCDPIVGAFELYETACGRPGTPAGPNGPGGGGAGAVTPVLSAPFSRITPVDVLISYQGEILRGYDVEAFDLFWLLPGGNNYALSVVLTGAGSLRQKALWSFSHDCSEPACRVRFNEAVVRGPSLGSGSGGLNSDWSRLSHTTVSPGVRRDLSFYLAGRKLNRGCPVPNGQGGTPPPPPTWCAGDFNGDGVWDLADLLDFLEVWLPGCP